MKGSLLFSRGFIVMTNGIENETSNNNLENPILYPYSEFFASAKTDP